MEKNYLIKGMSMGTGTNVVLDAAGALSLSSVSVVTNALRLCKRKIQDYRFYSPVKYLNRPKIKR